MTYIDYVNQFWKTHQSVAFSSNEVYLYFFLLNECNSRGWENPFECPNRRIVLATGISEPTVIEVRNRLQQKGLLQFESGKKNAKSPVYYLNDLSVIVKTCSDNTFTIVQKKCPMSVAKLGNILHSHNRMVFYQRHSVLLFPDFGFGISLQQQYLR